MEFDNHKSDSTENSTSKPSSISAKIRAFVAGLTPGMIFKYTFFTSVIIALAAVITYKTATDELHVNLDKVETSSVVLSGSDNLGGIGPGEYKGVEYSLTNNSTSPAYVFVKIECSSITTNSGTQNMYEVTDLDGWVRLTTAEESGELIYAYGTSGAMTPVDIGDEAVLSGRLHCIADAVTYSGLSGDDIDIDVTGCLVYGVGGDYNKSASSLWQAYLENKDQ